MKETKKDTAAEITANLDVMPYLDQADKWPKSGKHIMAQYDENSIIVYQAYRPEIADYAVNHQRFGGEFSYSRMSWVKPNFLWMMYRSGWATKEGQERILAICLKREFFDRILAEAVNSSFPNHQFESREQWKTALEKSEVRLQWDPDHDPAGISLSRRAVQLGLRGQTLREYGTDASIWIEDITRFVASQRGFGNDTAKLIIPRERIYRPATQRAVENVGIETYAL